MAFVFEQQSWSIHSSLGRTIAEIKSHLAASAMPFTTSSMLPGSLALGGSPTTSIGGSMNTMRPGLTPGSSGSLLGPTISPSSILQPSQVTQPPAASGTAGGLLPEIAALTDDQVSQVLSDEKAFEAFFESLERVRAIREQEYKLNISNRDIATANVAKAQEVERLRADVLLKRQELQATRTEYDALALQKQELAKVPRIRNSLARSLVRSFSFETNQTPILPQLYDRDTLVEKLTQAADQADQQSEDIVSQFMSGAMDFATFVHKYKEARILYHQRAAKRESLLMHRPR